MPEEKRAQEGQQIDEEQIRKKIVRGWLLYYHDRLEKYEAKKQFVFAKLYPGSIAKISKASSHKISDPTGKLGTELASLEKTEKWLELVEDVEKRLSEKQLILLSLRRAYRFHGTGWTDKIHLKYASIISKKTGLPEEECYIADRTTFWRWWVEIEDLALRMAEERGMFGEGE